MSKSNRIISTLIVIYITFSYFSPFLQLSFGINILTKNIGTFCLLLLFFYSLYSNFSNKSILKLFNLIFTLSIVFTISLVFNLSYNQSSSVLRSFFGIITIPIVIFIFYSISSNDKILKIVLYALVICSIINCVIALYSLYSGRNLFGMATGFGRFIGFDETTGRVGGIRGENYAGFWNVPAIVYFTISIVKNKLNIWNIILLLIALTGTVISLSRSSVLTALIAMILVLFFYKKRIRPVYFSMILLFSFIVLSIVIRYQFGSMSQYVYEDQLNRWNLNADNDNIDSFRFEIWNFWIDEFLSSSIIFGKGPGFINSIIESKQYHFVPHNSSLDVLVEFGIIGLTIFLIPIIYSVVLYFNNKYNQDYYLLIFIIIFLSMFVSLFFLSNPYLNNYWIFWGLIWGRYNYIRKCNYKQNNLK